MNLGLDISGRGFDSHKETWRERVCKKYKTKDTERDGRKKRDREMEIEI